MPLVTLSARQAIANLRASKLSRYPDGRRDQDRFAEIVRVSTVPSFSLAPGEPIFTVGSCFARNIEVRLKDAGFEMVTLDVPLPINKRNPQTDNSGLNKYTTQSMLNEIIWALDPNASFPEDAFLNLGNHLWHDPHFAPQVAPASFEHVTGRRAVVTHLYRQIPRCRLIVMTLGLAEAWFDEATQLYLNGAPPSRAIQNEPERFELHVLSASENFNALETIHDLLKRYGHPDFRLLLTVSPVPLKATYRGIDGISANTYAKSALRAAAEEFTLAHPEVDYFPSFEIVTLTDRSISYLDDYRHVNPSVVNVIVDSLVQHYAPQLTKEPRGADAQTELQAVLALSRRAADRGNHPKAAKLFGQLQNNMNWRLVGLEDFEYHFEYGRILLQANRPEQASIELVAATELKPDSAEAWRHLGTAYRAAHRHIEAEAATTRASELERE